MNEGGPTRSNSMEGGNYVPVDVKGPGRIRPIFREDVTEGFFAWAPDGKTGVYVGRDTNVVAPGWGNLIFRLWDEETCDFTEIEMDSSDAGGLPASGDCYIWAVKWAPFYSPTIGGYFCFILLEQISTGNAFVLLYNGGTGTTAIPGPPNVPQPGTMINYFVYPDATPVEAGGNPFYDIAFSWGGEVGGAVVQAPFGVLFGQNVTGFHGHGPGGNAYCIDWYDNSAGQPLMVPKETLQSLVTNLPTGLNSLIIKIDLFRTGIAVIYYDDATLEARIYVSVDRQTSAVDAGTFGVIDSFQFIEVADMRVTSANIWRPEYMDIIWGPDRNYLIVCGRHGRYDTIRNDAFIYQASVGTPKDRFMVERFQFAPATRTLTGVQTSPDGTQKLITSKYYNDVTVTEEDAADTFYRNEIINWPDTMNYRILTIPNAKVPGVPYYGINRFNLEHYRFDWHPYSRFAIFSIFGGLSKFDNDLYVDAGSGCGGGGGGGGGGTGPAVEPQGTGPAEPLFVQDTQHITLDEVTFTDVSGITGTLSNIFDYKRTTQVTTGVLGGTFDIIFKQPQLISRFVLDGAVTGLTVTPFDITGLGVPIVVLHTGTGYDSGNLTPTIWTRVTVNMTGVSNIREIAIFKTFEVKATIDVEATTSPADPLFVQEQGQMVEDEINLATSTRINPIAPGTVAPVFDKSLTTAITYDGTHAVEGVFLAFRSPLLIGRVSVAGTGVTMRRDVTITVTDVEGFNHTVYDGSALMPELVNGVDSGNFKQQPNYLTDQGGPQSPIMAASVTITTSMIGPAWDMAEVMILKVKETKSYVYNEPAEPVFIQDDQHLCLDEIWWEDTVMFGPVWNDPKYMFDKDPHTDFVMSFAASVTLYMNTPHLISRLALVGTCTDFSIELVGLDGHLNPIVTHLTQTAGGWDSGNFTPMLVSEIYLYTGEAGNADIYDLTLLKSLEVKPSTAPDSPTHVQAEQQIVASEIMSYGGTGTNPEHMFDKNALTSAAMAPGAQNIVINLTHPIMVGHVALMGILDVVTVTVNRIDGTTITVIPETGATDHSQWSGNFPPVWINSLEITQGIGAAVGSTLFEMAIAKVIEVKPTTSAEYPLFVQMPQQVTMNDIDASTSILLDADTGTLAGMFDKDISTYATFDGSGPEGATIYLKAPLLISRIALAGGPTGVRNDIIIRVRDVDGVDHIVYREQVGAEPTVNPGYGVDSGNFKDQPRQPYQPYEQVSPIMAHTIYIVTNQPGPVWDLSEILILKTVETKAFVYNEPSAPVFVQDDQHICLDEIWWPGIDVTPPTAIFAGDLRNMFDKNPETSVVISNNVEVILPFNTPHMISRISFVGSCIDLRIAIRDMNNFDVDIAAAVDTTTGWECNFERRLVKAVIIETGEESGNATIYDLIITKSEESPVVVEVPNQILYTEVNTEENNSYFQAAGASTWTNSEGGLPVLARLFDRMSWPGVNFNFVNGAGVLVITFWVPQLISRVAIAAGSIPAGASLDVVNIHGTHINWLTTSGALDGLDTGNQAPILATAVELTLPASATTLCEFSIFKTLETKIATDIAYPTQVEAEQQVVVDEVNLPACTFTVFAGATFSSNDATILFDKRYSTTITYVHGAGAAGVITTIFKKPELINRIGLSGTTIPVNTVIQVTGFDGTVTTLLTVGTPSSWGVDTGNFLPLLAKNVIITLPANATLSELTILKVIETKAMAQVELPQLIEFTGQKVYFDPLNTNTGGQSALQYYTLQRVPLETNADDDPAQNLDSTVTSFASSEDDIERVGVYFHCPKRDIRKTRNWAAVMMTVETSSANTRITTVRSRLYVKNTVTDALTAITAEKSVTLNLVGAAVRRVRFILQDWISYVIPPGSILVLQARVFGRQVASNATPSVITLWHRRGTFDTKLDTEVIVDAQEVLGP